MDPVVVVLVDHVLGRVVGVLLPPLDGLDLELMALSSPGLGLTGFYRLVTTHGYFCGTLFTLLGLFLWKTRHQTEMC